MKQIIEFLKQCQVYEETWNPADRAERKFRNAQTALKVSMMTGDKTIIKRARRDIHRSWVELIAA